MISQKTISIYSIYTIHGINAMVIENVFLCCALSYKSSIVVHMLTFLVCYKSTRLHYFLALQNFALQGTIESHVPLLKGFFLTSFFKTDKMQRPFDLIPLVNQQMHWQRHLLAQVFCWLETYNLFQYLQLIVVAWTICCLHLVESDMTCIELGTQLYWNFTTCTRYLCQQSCMANPITMIHTMFTNQKL